MSFEDVAKSTGLSEEQIASIPEELRNDKSLEPIRDLTGLITSHRDAQKFVGGSVRIPKEDSKPEEWDSFYGKIGRPGKAEEYQYKLPYPEFIQWDKNMLTDFANVAHKAGFTNKQVQEAITWFGEQEAQRHVARKESFDEAVNLLKTEWGGAFERNLALAKRVTTLYGGEEAKRFFNESPLGNDPALIRMLAKIGSDLEEGEFLGGPGDSSAVTPEEAKAQISEILANKEDLYHAKFSGTKGHKERVEEVQKLYAIAYGRI